MHPPSVDIHKLSPRARVDERVERALVVEDCPRFGPVLCEQLEALVGSVTLATTAAEAREALLAVRPQLVLLDVCLPDGTGVDVLEAVERMDAVPVVVVLSAARDPVLAFRLAEAGARAFLQKPVTPESLQAAIATALATPPNVTPHLRASVGHVPVRELESHVRDVMVREALARSKGNRRGAARLLSISRQLLQHVLREMSGRA